MVIRKRLAIVQCYWGRQRSCRLLEVWQVLVVLPLSLLTVLQAQAREWPPDLAEGLVVQQVARQLAIRLVLGVLR